jgi:hypothetical protein
MCFARLFHSGILAWVAGWKVERKGQPMQNCKIRCRCRGSCKTKNTTGAPGHAGAQRRRDSVIDRPDTSNWELNAVK